MSIAGCTYTLGEGGELTLELERRKLIDLSGYINSV